jgi:hypothetical protein
MDISPQIACLKREIKQFVTKQIQKSNIENFTYLTKRPILQLQVPSRLGVIEV